MYIYIYIIYIYYTVIKVGGNAWERRSRQRCERSHQTNQRSHRTKQQNFILFYEA